MKTLPTNKENHVGIPINLNPYLEDWKTQIEDKNLSVKELVDGFPDFFEMEVSIGEIFSDYLRLEYEIEESVEEIILPPKKT